MNMTMERLNDLIDRGAIFYVSHSGGKDSQAMYLALKPIVPSSQLVLVHADLAEVEWPGTQAHIMNTTSHVLNVVKAVWKDGSAKTFLGMVEKRFADRPDVPSWPSSAHRQCTSDLKRGPIYTFIRNDMKHRGSKLAVNCMGLRAAESSARSKLEPFKVNAQLSKAGREVYDWLPIHDWSTKMVFSHIKRAGQEPHWAYAAGNDRLSCMFCIMGCDSDLKNAAKHNPELARRYVELEQRTGYTFKGKQALADIIATDAA